MLFKFTAFTCYTGILIEIYFCPVKNALVITGLIIV